MTLTSLQTRTRENWSTWQNSPAGAIPESVIAEALQDMIALANGVAKLEALQANHTDPALKSLQDQIADLQRQIESLQIVVDGTLQRLARAANPQHPVDALPEDAADRIAKLEGRVTDLEERVDTSDAALRLGRHNSRATSAAPAVAEALDSYQSQTVEARPGLNALADVVHVDFRMDGSAALTVRLRPSFVEYLKREPKPR